MAMSSLLLDANFVNLFWKYAEIWLVSNFLMDFFCQKMKF